MVLTDLEGVLEARLLDGAGATDLLGPSLPGGLLVPPLEARGRVERGGVRAAAGSPELPVVVVSLCAHR